MDKISGLPDDVLVKILSFLPTKEAVATSLLSKQWQFLWIWLPKLDFISMWVEGHVLRDFIDKNLPLHRAPIIDCLRLKLFCLDFKPGDISRWIKIAVSRHVRELKIEFYSSNENILPSNLFTCKSLVTLKLQGKFLVNVPRMVCLPSLKNLQLEHVRFVDGVQQLLSGCPVLENLWVDFYGYDKLRDFTIIIPSLQSLSLFLHVKSNSNLKRYEIDTPSLKYFKLVDWNHGEHHHSLIKNMPKLREAYVDVGYSHLNSFIGSITSVKRLTLCSEGGVYGDGFVFNHLEHLKLCMCKEDSLNLFGLLLKDSPNLRVLDISPVGEHWLDEVNCMVRWNQPSSVPKCLLSSLEIFNWSQYLGRPQDRDIAVYILANAFHLKMVTIKSKPSLVPMLMELELEFSSRASTIRDKEKMGHDRANKAQKTVSAHNKVSPVTEDCLLQQKKTKASVPAKETLLLQNSFDTLLAVNDD